MNVSCTDDTSNFSRWDPSFLNIVLDIQKGVGDTSSAVATNHTAMLVRVNFVIGIVISILSILTVKIALVQLMQLRERHLVRAMTHPSPEEPP